MQAQIERVADPRAGGESQSWRPSTRVGFRFVFCYFLLYIFPGAVGSLRAYTRTDDPYRQVWHAIVPWVGENLLHLHGDMTEVANGSGDQLYDYVLLLCLMVVAAIVTAIWSWIDRKRTNYDHLYQWLRVFVRLTLAVAMISYGANKLFRMQFPPPPSWRFVDYYGNSAPMGLLWTFMGMSRAYSFFGGCGEMLGGLLLIVPRLTTLGALVSFAVMSNVLMLNFCYDVPRKIYSVHLVLMSLFLLLPDARRLLDFFILNRKIETSSSPPLLEDKQLNHWALYLQVGIGAVVLVVCLKQGYLNAEKAATLLPSPIRGIWSVDEFAIDGTTRPPLLTDTYRWQRLIFDSAPDAHEGEPYELHVQLMDSNMRVYNLHLETTAKAFTLAKINDPDWKATFTYEDPEPNRIILDGQFDGHQVNASLTRVDLSQFLLLNRGLHMISQYPLKR